MAAKKEEKMSKEEKAQFDSGVYKGYDIRWLRDNPDHPDFNLVAEYDKLVKAK